MPIIVPPDLVRQAMEGVTDSIAAQLISCAFELASRTPKHLLTREGALAVGAILIDKGGGCHGTYSGADHGLGHAEELLFREAAKKAVACEGGILISTHEPCFRRSDPNRMSCAKLIAQYQIGTVIFSVREQKPPFQSLSFLQETGVRVIQVPTPT
ncbi:MAG: hypothetical protein WDO70_12305 [Alphaproteobacteria bacterium]